MDAFKLPPRSGLDHLHCAASLPSLLVPLPPLVRCHCCCRCYHYRCRRCCWPATVATTTASADADAVGAAAANCYWLLSLLLFAAAAAAASAATPAAAAPKRCRCERWAAAGIFVDELARRYVQQLAVTALSGLWSGSGLGGRGEEVERWSLRSDKGDL